MPTVKRGTVVRMIWKKARLTRELCTLDRARPGGMGAYRDKLDTAMFAVNRTEKAARMACSLRPRCDSLK